MASKKTQPPDRESFLAAIDGGKGNFRVRGPFPQRGWTAVAFRQWTNLPSLPIRLPRLETIRLVGGDLFWQTRRDC